jgi:hypothetical protein
VLSSGEGVQDDMPVPQIVNGLFPPTKL